MTLQDKLLLAASELDGIEKFDLAAACREAATKLTPKAVKSLMPRYEPDPGAH